MADIRAQVPSIDFSPLAQLPSIFEEAQAGANRKRTLADLDLSSPELIERSAMALGRSGNAKDVALSLKLAELARERRSAEASAASAAEARKLGWANLGESKRQHDLIEGRAKRAEDRELAERTQIGGAFAGIEKQTPEAIEAVAVKLGKTGNPNAIAAGQKLLEFAKAKRLQEAQLQGDEAARTVMSPQAPAAPSPPQPVAGPPGVTPAAAAPAAPVSPLDSAIAEARAIGQASGSKPLITGQAGQAFETVLRNPLMSPATKELLTGVAKEGIQRESATRGKETEEFLKYRGDISKGLNEAENMSQSIDRMETILSDPGFISGTGTDTLRRVGSFVATTQDLWENIGVPVPKWADVRDPVKRLDTFNSLSNKMVLAQTGGSLGNQISNADRDYIRDSTAGLSQSKRANVELLQGSRALAQRQKEIAQIAIEYHRSGGTSKTELENIIKKYNDENRLFVNKDGTHTPLGQKIEGAKSASGANLTIRREDEGRTGRLPDGRRFVIRNGVQVPLTDVPVSAGGT